MRCSNLCSLGLLSGLLFSIITTIGAGESLGQAPVPKREEQQKAMERIRSVFGDEYDTNVPAEKAKFAQQLLELAGSENDDVAKFTLFREAVRFASESGDVPTAMKAVDAMSEAFAINPGAVRLYALANISKLALTDKAALATADTCLAVAGDRVVDNDYAGAKKAVSYGLTALRRVRDAERATRLREMGDYIDDVARQFEKVSQHAAKLKEDPLDPLANTELGRFECFIKGDWAKGLPHLKHSSDEALKKLAKETLEEPDDPQAQFKIANAWWKQADTLSGPSKDRVLAYAARHYAQALPGLNGLSKATAEKRLSEAPTLAGAEPAPRQRTINLLALLEPDKDFKPRDKWAISNGALQCTRGSFVPKVVFPYQPPEEYDVTFTFSQPGLRNGVGIIMPNPNGEVSFLFYIGSDRGRELGLSGDPAKYKQKFQQPVVKINTRYTVVFKVRKQGLHATVNGTPVINLQTDFKDLKVGSWQRINEWQNFALYCDDPTTFYQVQLTEVSGEGAVTRFPKSE